MITASEILNTYNAMFHAKRFWESHHELIEAILAHQGETTPLTVRGMGEEIMGEAYYEPFVWGNGEKASFRTTQARTMTSYLTQAFRKLVAFGFMTFEDRRDMEHPTTFTDYGYHYETKDGKVIPDEVEVTLSDGRKTKIPANCVPGVREVQSSYTRTVYPKVRYYYFK